VPELPSLQLVNRLAVSTVQTVVGFTMGLKVSS
jgi:hypothetical protein